MSYTKQRCDMCRRLKRNVSLEPSRSQLVFGGFPVKLEHRCAACERRVCKRVAAMIRNI